MRGLLVLLVPLFAQAAETDIVPRTVNFIIFAAILYFLVAKHVKNMHKTRIAKIQNKLSEIEKNLHDARENKDETAKHIEAAKEQANEILKTAKEQIESLKQGIAESTKLECEHLKKLHADQREFAIKDAQKQAISEVLDELMLNYVNLSEKDLLEIVEKKAS